ncbi:putative bifunctional diguanylate cyclase/phosphodiesterase [Jatrophihabitans sp. DSM 45814]
MESTPSVGSVRRSVLERVLDVVRELGAARELQPTLDMITRAIVDVVGFGAVAINVTGPGDQLRVAAVAGPAEVKQLLGETGALKFWLDLLESAEPWGNLRFLSHTADQTAWSGISSWTPERRPAAEPQTDEQAWHPNDSLLAPMWDPTGRLLGVLSVDQPRGGKLPDLEQRTILELFAAQAAIAIADSRARQESEDRREDAEQRWQLTFDRGPTGAAIVDVDGRIVRANDTFLAMLGYPRDELEGVEFVAITHPDDIDSDLRLFYEVLDGQRDSYVMEKRYLHADGHLVWAVLHVGVIRDESGGIRSIISQLTDITDRKLAEAELARRASHDPLTALPNRSQLEGRLNNYLGRGMSAGVLFVDLDRFKTVNDSLGHEAGDELLIAVTARLSAAVPESWLLGRVGGDEFAVIVPNESDPQALERAGELLMSAFVTPLLVRGYSHTVSMSVGVTAIRPQHRHADEVLREADQAMLRAKRHGRARVEVFDPTQDKPATLEDLELEEALRVSLNTNTGLIPYFQPIINLSDSSIAGYEALVRWLHPSRGLLEPDQFLPLAEKTGLIVPIGWWMLEASNRAMMRRDFSDGGTRWVAVNVSGSQLGRGLLVPNIERVLAESGLPPEQLHVEITETALIEASTASIKEVRGVADLGVEVALDDFGTGYSSLTLLRDLPVSIVKIDRSFISPIGLDRSATAIVRRVIALCQELGVVTVAEGVETQSQLTALRSLGCTQAQGYLIGPPEPLAAFGIRPLKHGRSSA